MNAHFSSTNQFVVALFAVVVSGVLAVLLIQTVGLGTAKLVGHTVMLTSISVMLASLRYPKMWPWLHRRLRVSFRLDR